MGAIAGQFGLAGGASGSGFAAPAAANIVKGVDANQIGASYTSNQDALAQQKRLLDAINAANGVGNQNQVFNQLQGIASGAINPAQNELNQNTGTNVANAAAVAAGTRGASNNVGLIARNAAQQGASTQQQAVGQAATLEANNKINAINAAGNIASTQAGNQITATNANTSANQAEQANLLNANASQNANEVASQGSVNSANSGLIQTSMKNQADAIGGALNSAGAAFGLAEGGEVPGAAPSIAAGPVSSFGQFISGVRDMTPAPTVAAPAQNKDDSALKKGSQSFFSGAGKGLAGLLGGGAAPLAAMAEGGEVPIVVSPGERILNPAQVGRVAQGEKVKGEKVPGKAKVSGDSYENDTYHTTAPAGSIVIPRHVAQGENPINDSARFVAAVLAKKGRMRA